MKSKNSKNLFEFDKEMTKKPCHCEEGQSIDAAIQEKTFGLRHCVSNNFMVIGTDEAGRGPGAGGVFASAVYFHNLNNELMEKLSFLNDSKKLSRKKREELYEIIRKNTINATVCVEVEEIEKINILNASLKAMKLACEDVIKQIETLFTAHGSQLTILVDGNKLIKDLNTTLRPLGEKVAESRMRGIPISQQYIIKGDSKSASIAAASILAKVSRDRYMQELDKKFPQYNWKQNAGYLTTEHLKAIEKYGITPIHRKSFLKGRNTKQLSLLN